ncbi:REP element-mobilizing transposase RayT [Algoriphagus ratkowskyi]|uniref:IS200/IS605 family transposase n=1 Tax=Algoriphagus ratkowskyi TaxID=57028 RepID=A0A2W7REG7_9BACT|nr:IS200/IS605 family transposase [Algoriphagus ratkowskyi]PZX59303.1 REP element-mobilizing transposase RayT [Algoriphagus ratkowskyi]TXD77426.1 IS200/IS605 family transposase [Algoriphagus ratkowskyi]
MANTYHQIYIQLIFAVKGRQSLLKKEFRQEFFKVMVLMIQDLGHKSIIVNGVADHVHCFIGLNPDKTISDLVEKLKTSSNHFLKDKKWADGNFSWQKGYGAFSYSKSHVDNVYQYILNQEIHHQKMTFKEEYMTLLRKFEIEFKDEYLFEFLDDVPL